MYEAEGTLYRVFETEQISDTFKKRLIVVEIRSGDQGQYVEHVPFELINKATHYADNLQEGTPVRVRFSLRGREYQPKNGWDVRYFGSLSAYGLQAVRDHGSRQPPPPPFPEGNGQNTGGVDDDLNF